MPSERRKSRVLQPHNPLHKEWLTGLRNLLKLPKARLWIYCEFFYADIDRQLFLGENDFQQCLRESFPSLRSRQLLRTHWRRIRHLIGKPRRCSHAFLQEERLALERKREKVRELLRGQVSSMEALTDSDIDLPPKVSQPLLVGCQVLARVRLAFDSQRPTRDGLFAGRVEAVMDARYLVAFERDMLPPTIMPDTDLCSLEPPEPLPLQYFIDKSRMRATSLNFPHGNLSSQTSQRLLEQAESPLVKLSDPMLAGSSQESSSSSGQPEMVGAHPVRLLRAVIRLHALLQSKRNQLNFLTALNEEAERIALWTGGDSGCYPEPLQQRYAYLLLELEHINLQLLAQLRTIHQHSQARAGDRAAGGCSSQAGVPDAQQQLSVAQAAQIVRHCNVSLQVRNRRALQLLEQLLSLLLQTRQPQLDAPQLRATQRCLQQLSHSLDPRNFELFQDCVEVPLAHMLQQLCTQPLD